MLDSKLNKWYFIMDIVVSFTSNLDYKYLVHHGKFKFQNGIYDDLKHVNFTGSYESTSSSVQQFGVQEVDYGFRKGAISMENFT